MSDIEEQDLYGLAVNKWGKDTQIDMAIEELSELIKVLAKRKRKVNGSSIAEIYDEIVDVDIMLHQLRIIFIFDDKKFNIVKNIKLKRLKKILEARTLKV